METNVATVLAHSFGILLNKLAPLEQEELNTVPFPGSWTAAQVGEHLLKSYDVVACLTGTVAPTSRKADAYVKPLSEQFLNFDIKMESPDFIRPSAGVIDKSYLMAGLNERTKGILDYAESGPDLTLTCLDFELPGLGALTRLEWLNFVNVHTIRHNHQLVTIIQYVSKS